MMMIIPNTDYNLIIIYNSYTTYILRTYVYTDTITDAHFDTIMLTLHVFNMNQITFKVA